MSQIILTNEKIKQKIERIAYQIIEDNLNEPKITLVGIANTGYDVAKQLYSFLIGISNKNIELLELKVDKKNSIQCLHLESNLPIDKDSVVILVDDVLNTGETLMHSSFLILKKEVKKLRTAVLVDRRHRLFPIRADFAGLTLSTTLEDHIEVASENEQFKAFLE